MLQNSPFLKSLFFAHLKILSNYFIDKKLIFKMLHSPNKSHLSIYWTDQYASILILFFGTFD